MNTITISRDTFNDPIFRSPERLRIWLALLFAADENGEIVISLRQFAKSNNVTYSQLRCALNTFSKASMIAQATAQATAQQGTQIKVCNPNEYIGLQRKQQRNSQRKQQRTVTPPKALPIIAIPPSFVTPEFSEAWNLWLDYRKETKRPYKSEKSERIGYEQLVKKSNNDPKQALEIVKNTIANGYQGLFALKDERKDKRNNSAVRSGDDRYAALERAAASILCGVDTNGCSGNGQG